MPAAVTDGAPIPGRTAADLAPVLAYLRRPEHRKRAVSRLADLVRIPSISGHPGHVTDLTGAARYLGNLLGGIGLRHVEVLAVPTGAAPSVYGEWRQGSGLPTLLLYGHYDVQPPGPIRAWRRPPFAAHVSGGHLYGRGASDDKGQLLTHLGAIEAWLAVAGRLPVNVKVWLDGEEEIGSPNLEAFLAHEGRRLECDATVVSDTQMLGPGRPTIVYGLRGLVAATIEIRGSGRDLHDGLFGGVAPNPIHELVRVLGGLHDASGRVAVPGFYDRVHHLTPIERARLRGDLPSPAELATVVGPFGPAERDWSPAERIAVRPVLNVTSVSGGTTGPRPAAIVPSAARARVNLRLVPDQNPSNLSAALGRRIASLARPPFRARVVTTAVVDPVVFPRRDRFTEAARRAGGAAFGRPVRWVRSGGTIPAVSAIWRRYGVPVILLGFGLPDDAVHGPNERFPLANLHQGTETLARLLAECAP